ncbi:toxin co-regulated pilus biosynthesis Q family protein [Morganella psychrotolerans]|uniref:toxin co-regulated pilus biosynthesis Q family protein n=1 Tax=Morganella psychrotolerans TaxID=368603 RepID=UPI0039AF7D7A
MKHLPMLVLIIGGLGGCTFNVHQVSPIVQKKTPKQTDLYVQTAVVNFIDLLDKPVNSHPVIAKVITPDVKTIINVTSPKKIEGNKNHKHGISIPEPRKPTLIHWNLNKKTTNDEVVNSKTDSVIEINKAIKNKTILKNNKIPAVVINNTPSKINTVNPLPVPVKPLALWEIAKGETLRDGVTSWSAKAPCQALGTKSWSVIWQTDVNYSIDAPLQFSGDFKTALNEVFELYLTAKKPLFAETNTPQCLIRVTDGANSN